MELSIKELMEIALNKCNMSYLKRRNLCIITEKKIRFEMNPLFLNEYFTSKLNSSKIGLQLKVLTLNYNLFVVHHGIGRLVFI